MRSEQEIEDEIESLVRECGTALWRSLRGKGHREDVIGLAINDALMAIVLNRRCGDTLEDPKAYLFVVARNAAARLSKSLYAVEIPDSLAIELRHVKSERDGEDSTREREHKALRRAIAHLPRRQREIMELRLQGFGVAETAAIMGIRAGTVGPATTSAVRSLKRILTEPGGIWEEET